MLTDPAVGWVAAYIGIGSNLSNPVVQVKYALRELARLPESCLTACSALYRTLPVGPQDQPDFVNAAVSLNTRLGALDLLAALQDVEDVHGRLRNGTRWGPRTLDLDMLLYGDVVIDSPELRVPHPELARRAFVLAPLADIAPFDLCIPGQGLLTDLLAACSGDGIWRQGSPAGCEGLASLAES